MMYALGSSIVTTRAGRIVAVASNAPADRVRAGRYAEARHVVQINLGWEAK